MGSKRAQKAKKRSQRQAKRQVRRTRNAAEATKKEAQRQAQHARKGTEASSTRRAPSTQLPTTAPTPPPPTTCSPPNATLIAPAYILKTTEECWDCYRETVVFALAAEGMERQTPSFSKLDRFVLMKSIEWLSPDLREFLKKHSNSAFSLDESTRDDGSPDGCWHYVNHCSHCGAAFDDYGLHETGAFSPMDEDDVEYMTVIRLPEEVDLRISAKPGFGMSEWQSLLRRP